MLHICTLRMTPCSPLMKAPALCTADCVWHICRPQELKPNAMKRARQLVTGTLFAKSERQAGAQEHIRGAHRQKLPVWPVVSIPAKKRAAISGSSCLSERICLVRGSLVFISRSAKVPGCSLVDFVCFKRSLMIFCKGRMQHQSQQ